MSEKDSSFLMYFVTLCTQNYPTRYHVETQPRENHTLAVMPLPHGAALMGKSTKETKLKGTVCNFCLQGALCLNKSHSRVGCWAWPSGGSRSQSHIRCCCHPEPRTDRRRAQRLIFNFGDKKSRFNFTPDHQLQNVMLTADWSCWGNCTLLQEQRGQGKRRERTGVSAEGLNLCAPSLANISSGRMQQSNLGVRGE